MRKCSTAALVLCAASAALASPATAGTFGKWETRSASSRCWAYTQPIAPSGDVARGQPYLSIQNHKPENIRGSIAVISGVKDSAKGEVSLSVDGKSFEMLPFGDAAFARTGAPETALIAAMRSGKELTVTWSLPSGAKVIDRYGMDGFSAAKADIDNCR